MKVIIACLNSKFVHASLSPWCLLAGLRTFCETSCDAQVLESTINGDPKAFACDIIDESKDLSKYKVVVAPMMYMLREDMGSTPGLLTAELEAGGAIQIKPA